jgi:hypothetical protein
MDLGNPIKAANLGSYRQLTVSAQQQFLQGWFLQVTNISCLRLVAALPAKAKARHAIDVSDSLSLVFKIITATVFVGCPPARPHTTTTTTLRLLFNLYNKSKPFNAQDVLTCAR